MRGSTEPASASRLKYRSWVDAHESERDGGHRGARRDVRRLDASTEQTREISLGRSKAVAPVRERGDLPADRWYDGPMLLEGDNTVSYVPAVARVRRDETGYLDIRLGDGREIA